MDTLASPLQPTINHFSLLCLRPAGLLLRDGQLLRDVHLHSRSSRHRRADNRSTYSDFSLYLNDESFTARCSYFNDSDEDFYMTKMSFLTLNKQYV